MDMPSSRPPRLQYSTYTAAASSATYMHMGPASLLALLSQRHGNDTHTTVFRVSDGPLRFGLSLASQLP